MSSASASLISPTENRSTLICRINMSIDTSSLRWRSLRLWCAVLASLLLFGMVGCTAYVRWGTTVVGDFLSPDERWDAVLIVRNGGAMTGYATAISVVRANWLARELALCALYRPVHVFVADDNDGEVPWGSQGQINVKVRWTSPAELFVTYPAETRVLRADSKVNSVTIRYAPSE